MDHYGWVWEKYYLLSGVDSFHSYEFATNEFVNAVSCVTLETSSTETGTKDFIAVGTTVARGEDLAAKGAVGGCSQPFKDVSHSS